MRPRFWVVAIAIFMAACAQQVAEDDQGTFVRTAAPAVADDRHVIVTMALADPTVLDALVRRLEIDHPIERVAEWPLRSIDIHCVVFRVNAGVEVEALRLRLARDQRVRTVQRMQRFDVLGYRDQYFLLQTGFADINAVNAHRLATGKGVRIAVVDTGIDIDHPDLKRQIDLARDFVDEADAVPSKELHGTAVAGVIAASSANGEGIVGVAPDARLLALRGCWQDGGRGRCSTFSLAQAINFALLDGAQIFNLSLSGPHDPLLAELLSAAIDRGAIVVVADAGETTASFPASLEGVIPVGTAGLAAGTQSASRQPLPAPGVDVISTAPNGRYDFYSGASIAAAHVSGMAALGLEREPRLTPGELYAALRKGVTDPEGPSADPTIDSCQVVARLISPPGPASC
ncbi:MAG: S8 family serine peptidase [Geminicoccaceae bacterium]